MFDSRTDLVATQHEFLALGIFFLLLEYMHDAAHHVNDFVVDDYLVLLEVLFLFLFKLVLFVLVVAQNLDEVEHVLPHSNYEKERSK